MFFVFKKTNYKNGFSIKSLRLIRRKARWQKKRRKKRRKPNSLEFIQYKNQALATAQNKIAHFNAFYKFKVNRVTIKNQKTRWGSCSKKGNLNFNYKIALLPPHLSDYVIVHELCHLEQLNHSPAFWNLVAKTIPQYKKIKKDFKKISIL